MPKQTALQQVLTDEALIVWMEEAALRFATQRFLLSSRVTLFTDMIGWADRKVSIYNRPTGASQLEEFTAIPANQVNRKRLAVIAPNEYGDRFPVSNRRTTTDKENVVADIVSFHGYNMGVLKERKLFQALASAAGTKGMDQSANDYSLPYATQLQAHFSAMGFDGEIFHVIHPYQENSIMQSLLNLTNAAVPDFRNQFIRQWNFGGFGGLNIAVSGLTPRRVVKRLVFNAAKFTDGVSTFQLRYGGEQTANITYDSTPADLVTAITNALNALTGYGTFSVAGAAVTDIEITPPTGDYQAEEDGLFFGITDAQEPQTSATNADFVNRNPMGNVYDTSDDASIVAIQEVSATARAPFWERRAVALDIRQPVEMYTEWLPSERTLDIGGTEVFGAGAWDADRAYYIETKATSPLAVP